ncbi:MAG: BamA/TamA family outer membrane protein [Pseudomonadota bacterium]
MVHGLVFGWAGAVAAASGVAPNAPPPPSGVSVQRLAQIETPPEGDLGGQTPSTDAAETAPEQDRSYKARFDGPPEALRARLRAVSSIARGERRLPTQAALRRVAKDDAAALRGALQSAGYYRAAVSFAIEDAEDKRTVAFSFDNGPKHRIVDYGLRYADAVDADAPRPETLAALGVETDGDADGARLAALQTQAQSALQNAGYPSAAIVSRRVILAETPGEARAEFVFRTGPRAFFNGLAVDGAVRTKPTFLEKLKTWEDGELFEQSRLLAFRDSVAGTGLFSSVDVTPGETAADGATPVALTLEERKPRTIGAGLSFSTAEGPGGRLFFEYRNLLGSGEIARAELQGTSVAQSLRLDLDKPLPTVPGSVFGQFGFLNQTTDAFTAQTITIGAGVAKRWFDDRLETRAGLAFESSRISEGDIEEQTYLVSAPLSANWNTEDDPLFLSTGERIGLSVIPYAGSDNFTRIDFAARSRKSFGGDERFTIAGRTRVAATFGVSFDDLPLTQRLFAGGGASNRGYGFQEAGPLDVDGDPVGGRSLVEGAIEARMKITDSIQIAAFSDASAISFDAAPDFAGDYLLSVGGGARYFTPIGPLRVDVAIPLDRRETDSSFQLYVSLGQPF